MNIAVIIIATFFLFLPCYSAPVRSPVPLPQVNLNCRGGDGRIGGNIECGSRKQARDNMLDAMKRNTNEIRTIYIKCSTGNCLPSDRMKMDILKKYNNTINTKYLPHLTLNPNLAKAEAEIRTKQRVYRKNFKYLRDRNGVPLEADDGAFNFKWNVVDSDLYEFVQ